MKRQAKVLPSESETDATSPTYAAPRSARLVRAACNLHRAVSRLSFTPHLENLVHRGGQLFALVLVRLAQAVAGTGGYGSFGVVGLVRNGDYCRWRFGLLGDSPVRRVRLGPVGENDVGAMLAHDAIELGFVADD